jgi:O-antigen/teichoic acid export membrane protein
MYRSYPDPSDSKLELFATVKSLIRYGLPVSIGAILTGFLTSFYGYILAVYVSNNATIGNYNVANNFVVLITFFSVPVTTMLFPAFSKLDAKKDHQTLKNIFQYSVKYASLLVVPVTAMVIVLAQPAISTIFQDKYVEAPFFLALLAITYFYTAIGNLSAVNIILGQGYTRFIMKTTILTAAIGFPLSFVLISQFGVLGLIFTTLTVGLPGLFLYLRFIKQKFSVSVDWLSSAKILMSSGITAALTYLVISLAPVVNAAKSLSALLAGAFNSVLSYVNFTLSQAAFTSLILLIIGVIAFAVIFVLTAVVTRTITWADLVNLREISNGLGPIRRPVRFALNVIEKLMRILQPKKDAPVNSTVL